MADGCIGNVGMFGKVRVGRLESGNLIPSLLRGDAGQIRGYHGIKGSLDFPAGGYVYGRVSRLGGDVERIKTRLTIVEALVR